MAVTTWDGSSSTDWNTAANWDTGAVPTSADDVIIPDDSTTANDCTLSATGGNPKNVKSLKIEANGTIVGGGIQIRIYGESAAGFALDNDGIISGSLFLEIKSDSTVSCDFAGSSGRFNSVTVNHASCIINVESTFHIDGNLTITLGKVICGGNTVEIAGKTTIGDAGHSSEDQATLQCDASAMFLGSGYTSDNAIIMLQGGTYVGGSGNHTSGAIKQTAAHTKLTFTTATHTINAEYPSDDRLFSLTAGKSFNADGRITLEGNFTSYIQWDTTAGDNGPHNLRLNDANLHAKLRTPMTIEGDLVIDAGRLNTQYDGTDHKDLTVTGYCDVTGTLTLNTSTVSVAALRCKSGAAVTQDATGTLALATGSNFGGTEGSAYSLRNLDGTSDINLGGTTTVTGGSYFEPRTATVYASVLNNIVWNSGQYWVGEIRIGGTLVVNAAKHMQPYGGSKNVTVVGAVTLNGQLSAYPNGHADLNNMTFASLTINTGGTYAATPGETSITGAGGINRAGGTFTHNNGTVDFEAATTVIQSTTMTGSNAFYILKSTGQTWYRIDQDIDIERHASTGYVFWFYGNVTVTMGTDTYASGTDNNNKCINWTYVYGTTGKTYKLYAKNELYPWQYNYPDVGNSSWINGSQDARMGTVHLKGGNIIGDFSIAETTNPKSMILDGDMEFDGVTVGNTNTLDLNGQRVEFGGLLNNQGILTDGGDKSLVLASNIDTTGTTRNISGASDLILTGSGNIYWGATGGGWNTAFFNGGAFDTWAGQNVFGTCLIGSGDLDVLHDTTFDNIKVATGGIFDGNSSTVTATGDFNSFGGLIGKSALNLTGAEEVTGSDNLDEVATTNKFTIEAWFKASTDANYRAIFSRGTSWATGNLYVYMNSDGYVQASANDLGNTLTSTTAGLADDKWHHVAYTYDTTTISLYIDGKLEATAASTAGINTQTAGFKIGDRSGDNWVGNIGRVSVWKNALSETLIRKMLFMDWTTMAADSDFTDSDAIGWWQFDEGTGTAVEDLSSQSNDGTLNSAAWAGAGTLSWTGGSTPSDGTLNMTGAGTTPTLTCKTATKFFNVTVGTSGEVTLAGHPYIYGLLTVDANGITDGAGAETIGIAGTSTPVVHASQDFSNISQVHYQTGGSAITITPTTYSICRLTASTAGTLVGAFVGTTLQVDGNCSLTAQNTTIQTRGFNINGANVVVNVVGTDITLTDASPYGFTGGNSTTTFSAGPGTTFTGNASKSKFVSSNNFAVVGKIENLDVTNEELKVTGQVINCTGDIHQYFPTIDHAQQLDADTADDRDVRLGRDLDKNTELINS